MKGLVNPTNRGIKAKTNLCEMNRVAGTVGHAPRELLLGLGKLIIPRHVDPLLDQPVEHGLGGPFFLAQGDGILGEGGHLC